MLTKWVEFTDGSAYECDGENASDVQFIAEHLHPKNLGKKMTDWEVHMKQMWNLPYPTTKPSLYTYKHPVYPQCPPFCGTPEICKGKNSCPKARSCCD